MGYLFAVSLLWAFSFGLIDEVVGAGALGGLDPHAVGFARMALALPLFLPLLRLRACGLRLGLAFAGIGAVQYGFMYTAYNLAFAHLSAYQVALFTIFTPLYVALFDDLLARRFRPLVLLLALVAVAGAAVLRYDGLSLEGLLRGFVLVQVSNACFAFGQVAYRHLRRRHGHLRDAGVYALLYGGALAVTAFFTTLSGGWTSLAGVTWTQAGVLVYLGVLASGLCFFWWNKGAVRVGSGTLAAFNNAKIPLAVLVSLLFFGERADLLRLCIGGALMVLAIFLAERWRRRADLAA